MWRKAGKFGKYHLHINGRARWHLTESLSGETQDQSFLEGDVVIPHYVKNE
jgi:hypothetical protein